MKYFKWYPFARAIYINNKEVITYLSISTLNYITA
uniref:Uncharacterized protein n=1 Tax=Firmicutes phage HS16 TaxID=3056394 RepID=A0AA49X3E3_9VIRU|nr:MAG: hypothetical protein [Firmicutes phage HS16]